MKLVNIGIIAHVDAGKTTITEQLLYRSGGQRGLGSVDRGTSRMDFLTVERARGISVKASSVTIIASNVQINIIDTPGHVDFIAEVERSLAILDTAILVISAVEGIQAQTEILYEALCQTHTNVIIFINKIDRVGSDYMAVIEQIKSKLTASVLLFSSLENEGEKTVCIKPLALEGEFSQVAAVAVADFNEDILSDYLADKSISAERLDSSLKTEIRCGNITPILLGSGIFGVGISELLDFVAHYVQPTKNNETDELSGVVYKITHDKEMGRIAHVRMFGGTIKNRDLVKFSTAEVAQKVTQIRRYSGSQFVDVGIAGRGDIVALCGLSNAKISDIFGEVSEHLGVKIAVPLLKVRVIPASIDQLYAVMSAFDQLTAEDPQLDMTYNQHEKELSISITGTIQLEILIAIVKERYGLTITFSAPTVIYKETPSKYARGFEAYTMPKPCWAVIALDIEPTKRGSGLSYHSIVSNDDILYRYQNHIETTIPRALRQGMYNWEVTDLDITLVGGEHHFMHTHPMDFFLATPLAVMDGLKRAGTTLLEPIQLVKISALEDYLGRVISDIIAMRGEFDSPVISNGMFTIEAQIPVATSLEYVVKLASFTSGRGLMSSRFFGYKPCPLELGAVTKRIGVNPLDREKWILNQRNAL